MKTDKELLEANAHIATSKIERDIADTEFEITTMEREAAGYEMVGDRMSMFRASARRDGIEERKKFIENLKKLLALRAKQFHDSAI